MADDYPMINVFLLGKMSERSKARVKTSLNCAYIEWDNMGAILQTYMVAATQSAAGDNVRAQQAYDEIWLDRTNSIAQLKW